MTQKFGRTYRITITPNDNLSPATIVIELPFTIEFWMQRNNYSSLNNLSIDIYNLSEATRNRIFQDRFVVGPTNMAKTIAFEAGYKQLYTIYSGNIFRASSAREGTNIVTRVECLMGNAPVANTQTARTLQGTGSAPLTQAGVIKSLIGDLNQATPPLQQGAIGNFPAVIQRPIVLNGNTWDLVKQYSDGTAFIDNGMVHALHNNEAIAVPQVPVLSDATGLLETPRRDDLFLTVTSLLETSIEYVQQQVQLQTSISPIYNGLYNVVGIQHRGMISAALCGDCRSIFNLLAPQPYGTPTQVPLP